MMSYNNVKHIGNYIVLNSVEKDNKFIVDTLSEYHIKGDIKKDVYGRVCKLMKFFDKYDLIIDTVSVLNKDSRKSKIDSFLGQFYDDVSESFKFGIGSLNYDVEITLEKNSKGITNKCIVNKNTELYKEFNISDFDKEIKYISKLIEKDKFSFQEFIDSYLVNNSGYGSLEIETLQNINDNLLLDNKDVKWSTCKIDKLENDDTSLELVIQKGKVILQVDVRKYSSRMSMFHYPSIKIFKSVNTSFVSCDTYSSFDEALREFIKQKR
jgi:hypothetical protein